MGKGIKRSVIERLMAKVDQNGPVPQHRPDLGLCWLWTAAKNNMGYGVITIDRRTWLAHRWLWIKTNGSIPDGLELDHFACDRPLCVNPAHLRPVTHAENLLRSETCPAGMHARKTECSYGHPFDAANTRIYRGARICVACVRRRNAARFQ